MGFDVGVDGRCGMVGGGDVFGSGGDVDVDGVVRVVC